MKKFFESLKDFLYDSVDYIIVLSILGIVVIIIGWRIDLLFANDVLSDIGKAGQVVDDNIDDTPTEDDVEKEILENDIDEITDIKDNNDTIENPDNNKDEVVEEPVVVKVSIPSGSLPSTIGSILEDKGLIISKNDFVEKSQELKLDTKLKSGDFNISTDSSIEEIIYIISK